MMVVEMECSEGKGFSSPDTLVIPSFGWGQQQAQQCWTIRALVWNEASSRQGKVHML